MTGYARPESLVATDWLAANLDAPDLRVVDATYYLPMQGKNARAEYEARHIPGAVFFDIDEIADETSPLPHMLPSPEKFAARMRNLGIGDGNRVVVYDSHGLMSSARVWWTLRVFGQKTSPCWMVACQVAGRGPAGERRRAPASRAAFHRPVRSQPGARQGAASGQSQEPSRAGPGCSLRRTLPCPRAGSLAWPARRTYSRFPQPAVSRAHRSNGQDFAARRPAVGQIPRLPELDFGKPVVTSCGSGITAAVLALALHLTGHRDVAVYDGSWAEWGLPGRDPRRTMSFAFRTYRDEDFDAVIALWRAGDLLRPHHDPAREIAFVRDATNAELILAFDDGRLAGSIQVGHDGHRAWMYRLAVDPGFRRRGCGRALVARAEDWALAADAQAHAHDPRRQRSGGTVLRPARLQGGAQDGHVQDLAPSSRRSPRAKSRS